MVSVDVVAVGLTIFFILANLEPKFHLISLEVSLSKAMDESLIRGIVLIFFRILFVVSFVGSIVFFFVGIVALALNIPVFRKTFREKAKLDELGLGSLSKSLWQESRRSRWIRRARSALLIVLAAYCLYVASQLIWAAAEEETRNSYLAYKELIVIGIFFLLYFPVVAGLMFAGRYLRNHRERMELAASAEELKKALQSLQQRKGAEVISVPAELLEKTAKIESAQIAKERKDAILESVASPASGYAIAFDRAAAEQRATLDIADRVALEDLVERLSTDGTQVKPQAGAGQGRTKSNRVEIDYVIDNASRSIRVTAVRHVGEVSPATVHGGSHA
jgi:hypothetical protein